MLSFLHRLRTEPRFVLKRFLQCLLCWGTPRPRGNLARAQIILTQAASDLVEDCPSKTNHRVAAYASLWAERLNLPVYAQGEVARILDGRCRYVIDRTLRQGEARALGKPYLGTFEVALEQKRFCEEHQWTEVLAVSFRPHLWRAIWVYERLGFIVHVAPGVPHPIWQEKMEQRRWRHPIGAYLYELGARLGYLYWGYI